MKKNREGNHDLIGGYQPLGIDQEIPDGGKSSQGEDWAPTAKENPRPLIPEGTYEAMCVRQRKKYNPLFKREILTLSLQLFEGPEDRKVVRPVACLQRHGASWHGPMLAPWRVPPSAPLRHRRFPKNSASPSSVSLAAHPIP